MTSQTPGESEDPFAGLFRRESESTAPDEPAPDEPAPDEPAPPAESEPREESSTDLPVEPAHEEPTGRLFRSATASGEAIPALRSDQASRLRTVRATAEREALAEPALIEPVVIEDVDAEELVVEPRRRKTQPKPRRRRPSGLTPPGVCLVMFGLTLLVGAANALLHTAGTYSLGWPTGLALVIAAAYCAYAVRESSRALPAVLPPLAFGVAALTVGQIGLVPPGSTLVKRAVDTFFMLGANWYWMVGAIVVAVAIAIARALMQREFED